MQLTSWTDFTKIVVDSYSSTVSVDFMTESGDVAAYISARSPEERIKLIHLFESISHDLRAVWRKQIEDDPSLAPQPDEPQPKPEPIEDDIPY